VLDTSSWRIAEHLGRLRALRPDLDAAALRRRDLALRLKLGHARLLELHDVRLRRLGANLEHLNPRLVLERGYSMVTRADGAIVRSAAEVQTGERLRRAFARGAGAGREQGRRELIAAYGKEGVSLARQTGSARRTGPPVPKR
jgi:exodeoxyribonuclease VII large subunit